MKKILSAVLAICMLFTLALPAMAEEATDAPILIAPAPSTDSAPAEGEAAPELPARVEISFRVGESVLKINGADVEVATPYVVGEGVTLVPLRVITEAFGATVGWDGDTQTVTLDYPGVNIVLQIGNPVAEVNGKAQTLLAAPELPESSTMVPLRFISETFGATVSYDEATEAILVVKEAEGEGGTVVGQITTKRVGDSYYNWSMENPTNATMTERRFDGLYTCFDIDENNYFDIYIDTAREDFDLNREFDATKKGLTGYTLTKADKLPELNGYHIQARDKVEFIDMYAFNTEDYYFELFGSYDNENAAVRDECIRILSTFTLEYTTEDTHDLSNAKDGFRQYEDEDHGLSFPVPVGYYMATDEDMPNTVIFTSLDEDDMISAVSLYFYSVSEAGDAKALAEKDRKTNIFNYNEEITKFTEIAEVAHGAHTMYEYGFEVTGSSASDSYTKDAFFTVGDYVYNLSVHYKKNEDEKDFDFEAYAKKILDGTSAQPLDANEIGLIMRNDPNTTDTYVSKTDAWSLTVPLSYTELGVAETTAMYVNSSNGTVFSYLSGELANANFTKAQSELKRVETELVKDEGAKVIKSATAKNIDGKQYAYDILELEMEGEKVYVHQYACPANKNELHVFMVYFPELTYSLGNIGQFEQIVSTLVLK